MEQGVFVGKFIYPIWRQNISKEWKFLTVTLRIWNLRQSSDQQNDARCFGSVRKI